MYDDSESLFDKIFGNSWWSKQNKFPPCEEWKADIEKHLHFMQGKNWLESVKAQLRSRNYESFLSEIFAAYFIEENLRFEVSRWNTKTSKQGHDVEFCIKDRIGSEIFCEVKSPGWQGQLAKEEINSGRAKQPKYSKFPEARGMVPYENIRKTVRKSYAKFLSHTQNLLIITDNLFLPVSMGKFVDWCPDHKMPMEIYYALYDTSKNLYGDFGCFATKDYENLGGILFLNNRFLRKFFAWFESNPNAKIPLSEEFVSRALKLNKQRIKNADNDYINHDGTN